MSHSGKHLSRFSLKLIACISMLADHICLILFSGAAAAPVIRETIGRIAFPIFAYLIAEGMLHTRSRKRYLISVLILAVVSEPFFDMAMSGVWLEFGSQNTVFTLLIGLVMIMIMDKSGSNYSVQIFIIAIFGTAVWFLHVDYSFWGILTIGAYYLMRTMPAWLAAGVAVTPLTVGYNTFGVYLAMIPLFFYDKSRGTMHPALKYAFYVFYPAHLAALAAVKMLL